MSVETEAAASAAPDEAAIIASMAQDDPVEESPAASETAPQEDAASQEAGEVQEVDPADEPPEFWSAERKEQWAKLKDFPEVRSAIRGHVDDANKAISGKMEEAAKARKAAEDAAKQHQANQDQLAGWWQANGERIGQMVQGKWAGLDWNKLSAENPAEWARLRQQYESEMGSLREMNARHEAEVKAVETRRNAAHQQERAAEHEKLAKKFPKEFGTPEVAQKTYDTLSTYLIGQGVAKERIPHIYEAAVVEVAHKAYKYDQLQAKAKGVTDPKQAAQPASTTPRRVTPGAGRTANQGSDQERQAIERLRKGEVTEDVERWAFR